MDKINKYYVYGLWDLRNNQLIYVGKGCGGRVHTHQKIAEGKTPSYKKQQSVNTLLYRKLKKILKFGFSMKYHMLCQNLNEESALKIEEELINMCGRVCTNNGFLLNITAGGKASPSNKGKIASAETRRKISEGNRGKRMSEEAKKKISKANKGRKLSPERVEQMRIISKKQMETPEAREVVRQAQLGRKASEITKKKMSTAASGNKSVRHTQYLIETPEHTLLKLNGYPELLSYFSNLSDMLNLVNRQRISGKHIRVNGHSKGYNLLRKYRPNRKTNKLVKA